MPQPWPWVKVMERSSSTIPQTHTFFVPNIKGLAQTVLTWEGKVFAAAADADADADAAEMDWKHKVTPERGDLIIAISTQRHWGLIQPIKWVKELPKIGTDNFLTNEITNSSCCNSINSEQSNASETLRHWNSIDIPHGWATDVIYWQEVTIGPGDGM